MPRSCLLELLCLCDFFFCVLILCHLSAVPGPGWSGATGAAIPGAGYMTASHPSASSVQGGAACAASKSRARSVDPLPPPGSGRHPPSPRTPLTPQTPPIPLASCWRERDRILLPWQNTRLVCAPYHCCQLLSINIYSFCYTAFCMCVPFIMEKKIADKMVRAPTCRYPESEFLSRYLCAGLLGIGDFVTGFRA